jgi:diketogulonate reductase-like aldo/keto reductase
LINNTIVSILGLFILLSRGRGGETVSEVCRTGMDSTSTTLQLNDNNTIPILGLGVFQAKSGDETYNAVYFALSNGYRHVDTAEYYRNERDVGRAIRDFCKITGVSRNSVFVTTKYMPPRSTTANEAATKSNVHAALEKSLNALGLDYVDLYLIHSPHNALNRLFEWNAMEKLKDEGKAKSIGVSNYGQHHLEELFASAPKYSPSINQVEINPFIARKELVEYCKSKGIAVEAYSPLTKAVMLSDVGLNRVAQKYSKSAAQIMIRWCIQKGLVVLPKSVTENRIIQNSQVWDFEISEGDMLELDGFDRHLVTGWDPTTGE